MGTERGLRLPQVMDPETLKGVKMVHGEATADVEKMLQLCADWVSQRLVRGKEGGQTEKARSEAREEAQRKADAPTTSACCATSSSACGNVPVSLKARLSALRVKRARTSAAAKTSRPEDQKNARRRT